jgi:hypothetical protein
MTVLTIPVGEFQHQGDKNQSGLQAALIDSCRASRFIAAYGPGASRQKAGQ